MSFNYIINEYLNYIFMISNCGAQTIYGPGLSTQGKSNGPSRGELWPKPNKMAFGYRRG